MNFLPPLKHVYKTFDVFTHVAKSKGNIHNTLNGGTPLALYDWSFSL